MGSSHCVAYLTGSEGFLLYCTICEFVNRTVHTSRLTLSLKALRRLRRCSIEDMYRSSQCRAWVGLDWSSPSDVCRSTHATTLTQVGREILKHALAHSGTLGILETLGNSARTGGGGSLILLLEGSVTILVVL